MAGTNNRKTEKQLSIATLDLLLDSEEAWDLNFREIRAGKIAPFTLYRSSHPIKENKQEKFFSRLTAETRIASVLNLADNNAELRVKAPLAPWYNRLFKAGRVIALGMEDSRVFSGARFNSKLKEALRFITQTEGPWLIHCYAGIDRTGFVSMVLEAFMGADVDEIAADYLTSFGSLFESSDSDRLVTSGMAKVMKQLMVMGKAVASCDIGNLQNTAELYLGNIIGLSLEETELLKRKLGNPAFPA